MTYKLDIDGVHKRFRDRHVLRGINLTVHEHEVVCLIGPSGCGKSTLLRCIDLLETIDDGEIRLDGTRITGKNVNATEVRGRIGMVFQSYNLFPHMNVMQNVTLAAIKVHGMSTAAAQDKARGLLARFGLADKEQDYPDRISGGQQQRVSIVRALMGDPELLLLRSLVRRLREQLGRRARFQNRPLMQECHAIGHFLGKTHLVGGQHHRHSANSINFYDFST